MARGLILVKAAYDADAAVWFVESCDLEGVNAEAASLEELLQKLPDVILDLLEEEGFDDAEVPVELVRMPGRGCDGAPRLERLRPGRSEDPDRSRVQVSPAGPR
jgi:predicted RNase H-like HicB family nuclease